MVLPFWYRLTLVVREKGPLNGCVCVCVCVVVADVVLSGAAITDLFTIACTDWINCLGVDNDRLIYSYYIAPRDFPAERPLYSELNSTVACGREGNRGSIESVNQSIMYF